MQPMMPAKWLMAATNQPVANRKLPINQREGTEVVRSLRGGGGEVESQVGVRRCGIRHKAAAKAKLYEKRQ